MTKKERRSSLLSCVAKKGPGAEIMMFRRVRQRNVPKCACVEALFSLAIYTCYKFAWHFPDITPTIVG